MVSIKPNENIDSALKPFTLQYKRTSLRILLIRIPIPQEVYGMQGNQIKAAHNAVFSAKQA